MLAGGLDPGNRQTTIAKSCTAAHGPAYPGENGLFYAAHLQYSTRPNSRCAPGLERAHSAHQTNRQPITGRNDDRRVCNPSQVVGDRTMKHVPASFPRHVAEIDAFETHLVQFTRVITECRPCQHPSLSWYYPCKPVCLQVLRPTGLVYRGSARLDSGTHAEHPCRANHTSQLAHSLRSLLPPSPGEPFQGQALRQARSALRWRRIN
ncbi:hypothetical protein N658DRAFT_283145 [Parathielavia hyrcaniae]|uniref:Uncharacterized protein n=1 Tax=Parathielavia hyrcaniae TaxID=113614 RepID=A0AAN6Q677_9PEZI|nr:hypothetical protein N658DRAFT_283145 [Parathielavia hyrcaniae]